MLRFQLLFSLTQIISLVDMKFSRAVFLLVSVLLLILRVSAKPKQTDVNKPTQDTQGSASGGKIEVHQICNSGADEGEVFSLRKEVEMLRKDLSQRLDRIQQKGTSYRVS